MYRRAAVTLMCWVLVWQLGSTHGQDELADAMADRDFGEAVKLLDGLIAKGEKPVDRYRYLRALALAYDGKHAGAAAAADDLLKAHPDSQWLKKARFLKAKALADRKKFPEAGAIYKAEAFRLLSPERKEELAQVYIELAVALSTKPEKTDLKAPPPDYHKAHSLYKKALELEISPGLREECLFQACVMRELAQSYQDAIKEYEAYLREFEPDWARLEGGDQVVVKAPGKHRFEARLRLADCQLKMKNLDGARKRLKDLLAAKGLPAETQKEARHLLIRTYAFPNPRTDEHLEQSVAAAREFLKAYPKDPRSIELAYQIAEAYQSRGRTEEARSAYEHFIAGKGYELPEGDAATKDDESGKSPTEKLKELRMLATYQLGQLLFSQKRLADAIKVWQSYVAQFPDGPDWSASQKRVVDAEFERGVNLLADKKHDEAVATWQDFLRLHPLDQRAPLIALVRGQIHYQRAVDLEEADKKEPAEQAFKEAIAEWQRLVAKHRGSKEASLAQFRIGSVYEEKLGDLEAALEAYRKLDWGQYRRQARQRVAQMTGKQLTVSTERTFRIDEAPKIRLSLRNVEKVTCRLYRLDLEEYFRKKHSIRGIAALDLSLIDPDQTWEVEIEGYEKYKPIQQEIEPPMNDPGVCAVTVSEEDFEATTLVIKSSIDVIVKASRKEALVLVQDMGANGPVAGARVIVSNGQKIILEGQTGKDGVYRAKSDELKEPARLAVFVDLKGQVASASLNFRGLGLSEGLSPKGYLYTDRSAYRPGQAVNIRGIVRDVDAGSYAVREGQEWTVAATDPRGRVIFQDQVKLSDFGTFASSVRLAESAHLGTYRISLTKEGPPAQSFAGHFQVQAFQLQKVELAMEFPRRVYFRGEKVECTLKAAYYYGTPLAGKRIRYSLPDGRSFLTTSDEEGQATFEFDTTAMIPPRQLPFSASLEGEGVPVQGSVFLARYGFSMGLTVADRVVLSGQPFEVVVKTTAADGEPCDQGVEVAVLRQERAKPEPILKAVPWLANRTSGSTAEVSVSQHKAQTDAKTGEARVPLKIEKGGWFILRARGTDRFDQPIVSTTTVFVSDEDDATKVRVFAETSRLKVGDQFTARIHSRLEPSLALITFEGEDVLGYRVQKLEKGFNDLKFAVEHAHFPNFTIGVAAMHSRKLYAASKDFTVERELKITLKPDKESYQPGEELNLAVETTDQLGRPVSAELSLALVDAALFARFPDHTPSIRPFFEAGARRVSRMRAGASAAFSYSARTTRVVKEILEEQERLAQRDEQAVARGGEQAPQDAPQVVAQTEDLGQTGQQVVITNGSVGNGYLASELRSGIVMWRDGNGNGQTGTSQNRLYFGNEFVFGTDQGIAGGRGWALGDITPTGGPRKEVAGAGFWAPAVVTDDKGQATIPVRMPEKMALWRLTARGCTRETLVGDEKTEILTKKDFFVELRVPSVLVEGDKPRFMLRAHNLSDQAGEAELKLKLQLGPTQEVRTKRAAVPAKGQAEIVFDEILIPPGPQAKLEASAEMGDLSDAVARAVRVVPWGLEYADTAGGTTSTSVTAFVELPKGASYSYHSLSVLIHPTVKRTVIDMAIDPPGLPLSLADVSAPSSAAASDLLAVASALEYIKGPKVDPTDNLLLTRRAQALIASLTSTQQKDNGWSWCLGKNVHSEELATARTLWALSAVQNQAIPVSADTIQKAVKFLKTRFRKLRHDDNDPKSAVLHALSCVKEADFAFANRLYRYRNELSNVALAYTTLTFANLGRQEIAGELLDVLEKRRKEQDEQCWWAADHKTVHIAGDVEVTALCLLAFERARPQSPLVKQAAGYLLARRQDCGWSPSDVRGPVAAALSLYFKSVEYVGNDYELKVSVNDQAIRTLKVEGEQPTVLLEAAAPVVRDGRNKVELSFRGRGKFSYAVTLRGFSSEIKSTANWSYPRLYSRVYYHAPLEYEGRQVGSSTSPVTQLPVGERTYVRVDLREHHCSRPFIIEEPLPAGTTFVPGSLTGDVAHHDVADGKLILYYPRNRYMRDFAYQLVGYAPGACRIMPTTIRDASRPEQLMVCKSASLSVLAPGEKSTDVYHMNDGELCGFGQAYFNDGRYAEAKSYLLKLRQRRRDYHEKDVARMLLWIHTEQEHYDAHRVVEYFEVLRERFPDLYIPFDKILVVAQAYRDVEEFERSYLVYRTVIDTSFINDSNICEILEREGQRLPSFELQHELLYEYPDAPPVVSTYLSLAQALFGRLENLKEVESEYKSIMARPELARFEKLLRARWGEKIERRSYLAQITSLLNGFLMLYPADSLADDAAFSLANALIELEDYAGVVELCKKSQERHPKSDFLTNFQYVEGLGYFHQRKYKQAVEAALRVAEGKDENRDLARYIIAQVYHAQKKPADAIDHYREVEKVFPDAAEAIRYFEEKRLAVDEVTTAKPGEKVQLKLKHRNLEEALVRLYKVDLMKLYLRERNLQRIAGIQLAGIRPLIEQTVDLGKQRFEENETQVKLDLKDEGAYLAMCRGEDLFASGFVLITPLELEVQEDAASGRVRVNAIDATSEAYAADVHVKAIGSSDREFRSGETDLRGIFVADGLRGTATVIARDKESRYAFYRGQTWVGAPEAAAAQPAAARQARKGPDYMANVKKLQFNLQEAQVLELRENRDEKAKGVQVKAAF